MRGLAAARISRCADQLFRLGVLLGRARAVAEIDLLDRLGGEDAPREHGAAHALDVHYLDHVDEKGDRISNRSLLPLLVSAEPQEPLLNQVVQVPPGSTGRAAGGCAADGRAAL